MLKQTQWVLTDHTYYNFEITYNINIVILHGKICSNVSESELCWVHAGNCLLFYDKMSNLATLTGQLSVQIPLAVLPTAQNGQGGSWTFRNWEGLASDIFRPGGTSN